MATVRIGTSGWSFDEWNDTFYAGVPRSRWLAHYADVFSTVEVNYTFRRTMSAKTAADWVATVGTDFRFSVKAHQRITHLDRLKEPAETLPHFLASLEPLRSRLGPVLFQLPPNLPARPERLAATLALLPDWVSPVFEFRHPSWLTSETVDLLEGAGGGLVLAETDDEAMPDLRPGATVYLRMRRSDYDEATMAARARWLTAHTADTLWVYLKHDDDAPGLAATLRGLIT